MTLITLNATATEYWFAFYKDAPTVEAKGFSAPDGTHTELYRGGKTDDGRPRHLIIMQVSEAEYTAGFVALSNARKLEGKNAASAYATADFAAWSETQTAAIKVLVDKQEAMKQIMYALLANNAALRQIVYDNTPYTNAAALSVVMSPKTYGQTASEIEAKMNE